MSNEEINLAERQDRRSQKLFNLTEPGLKTAEDFYTKLASGDPKLIAGAIAPATENISAMTENTLRTLDETAPRGGELNLAKEETRIAQGKQVGDLATQAWLSAFPALANLAQGGIGLSINEVANAIAAFGGSSNSLSGASSSNQAKSNMEMAGKEQTLGFIGGLAGDAASVASAGMG